MSDFFRFPHTPHLVWLGSGQPRDDKVLADDEVEELLDGEVIVEEKLDGANIGLSVTDAGELRVQNRGQYLDSSSAHPQFQPLWAWLPSREMTLVDALYPDLMLFGEWCVAVHSVVYDRLPDWFLGFDVYDRQSGAFWDTARRDALIMELGLFAVPRLAVGSFSVPQLSELAAGVSRVGRAAMEGLIVRRETGGFTTKRAKLVRPEFAQAIEAHWSRAPMRRNRLDTGRADGV